MDPLNRVDFVTSVAMGWVWQKSGHLRAKALRYKSTAGLGLLLLDPIAVEGLAKACCIRCCLDHLRLVEETSRILAVAGHPFLLVVVAAAADPNCFHHRH